MTDRLPDSDGVEALLAASKRHRGRGAPLLATLARLRSIALGRIRLDANRQAVGSNYLSRIAVD